MKICSGIDVNSIIQKTCQLAGGLGIYFCFFSVNVGKKAATIRMGIGKDMIQLGILSFCGNIYFPSEEIQEAIYFKMSANRNQSTTHGNVLTFIM